MENNITEKTLEKIFDLIQKSGVDEEKVLKVKKLTDPERGEKTLQAYIQSGKVGYLHLGGNLNVESLPDGLKCNVLNLSENKTLKHLPKIQADEIWADNTNIQTIADGLKCKELDLNGNKSLKHLPQIEAEKILALYTNIQTIEDGLKCKKLILTGNKALKHLPKIEAGGILVLIADTNIQSIEDGFKCGELNLYKNKSLKKFPRNFKVEKLILLDTYFSQTHTEEKVRKLIKDGGGTVGEIQI